MPLDKNESQNLLAELKSANFASGPVVNRGHKSRFDGVFSKEEYTRCLHEMAHLIVEIVNPHVLVRVMMNHKEVPVSTYCSEVSTAQKSYLALDEKKLSQTVAEGATVNLNMLERLSPRFLQFSRLLETSLGCRLQTNLYYNEGSIAGFSPHYDTHDVIVCQISGEKRWQLANCVEENVSIATPSRPENAPKDWDTDIVLGAGDLIILPRGTWHAVTGTGEHSLHLTIGLRIPTFEDYLRWLGSHAGASPILRTRVTAQADFDQDTNAQILFAGLTELSERGICFAQFLQEFNKPYSGNH